MKHIIGFVAMLLPIISGAQSPPVRALTIGDSVPDLTITNIINYKTTTAKLSDFKDKLLILDFMATSCIGCIEKLPRYDSLQAIYKDQLVILIVSYEQQKRVETFFAKNPIGMYTKLPMASEDSVLSQLFPHAYISHEVWIKDGKVKAITGSEYVTANNIIEIRSGIVPSWPIKRDIENFDTRQPFLKINDTNIPYTSLPATKYYSSFFAHMPDLPVGRYIHYDSVNNAVKTTIINQSIVELYRSIFHLNGILSNSNVFIKTANPGYYYYNSNKYFRAGWDSKNSYCYETVFPANLATADAKKRMNEEINFYLGIKGELKDTIVNCLVLKRESEALLRTRRIKSNEIKSKESTISSNWILLNSLSWWLNNKFSGQPVLNDLSISENEFEYVPVDKALIEDVEELRRELRPYGIVLKDSIAKIQALIITEENPIQFTHSLKPFEK